MLNIAAPGLMLKASPNPTTDMSTIEYRVTSASNISIAVYDVSGKQVGVLVSQQQKPGTYTVKWNSSSLGKGSYFIGASMNGRLQQTLTIVKQ
jgi:methionine-rich copper-binding protein CopC